LATAAGRSAVAKFPLNIGGDGANGENDKSEWLDFRESAVS
jgi:hypothetical protein